MGATLPHIIDVKPRKIPEDKNNVLREYSLEEIDKNNMHSNYYNNYLIKEIPPEFLDLSQRM